MNRHPPQGAREDQVGQPHLDHAEDGDQRPLQRRERQARRGHQRQQQQARAAWHRGDQPRRVFVAQHFERDDHSGVTDAAAEREAIAGEVGRIPVARDDPTQTEERTRQRHQVGHVGPLAPHKNAEQECPRRARVLQKDGGRGSCPRHRRHEEQVHAGKRDHKGDQHGPPPHVSGLHEQAQRHGRRQHAKAGQNRAARTLRNGGQRRTFDERAAGAPQQRRQPHHHPAASQRGGLRRHCRCVGRSEDGGGSSGGSFIVRRETSWGDRKRNRKASNRRVLSEAPNIAGVPKLFFVEQTLGRRVR